MWSSCFRNFKSTFVLPAAFKSSSALEDVVVLSTSRTPVGSFRKSLSACSAPYLGSIAIKAAVERAGIEPKAVSECYFGNVLQAYVGQAPARQSAIFGGLDNSVVCTTVNKLCASGAKSIMLAAQTIALGHQDVVCAGGTESMSNTPFYIPRAEIPYGGTMIIDGINEGLTDAYEHVLMGVCAEKTVAKYKITREEQDAFAKSSYERSQAAAKAGTFDKEIVPVQARIPSKKKSEKPVVVSNDEEYLRVDVSRFPTLRTAFIPLEKGGTITAANASTLNDGAAATIITSAKFAQRQGLKPVARIVGYADAALAPTDFSEAPFHAISKLLKLTGIAKDKITLWEINEAFAVVPIVNMKLLELDPAKVNIAGGAVSVGHPIAMSGTRITNLIITLLKKGEYGVIGICNGGGGASAIMVEKLM